MNRLRIFTITFFFIPVINVSGQTESRINNEYSSCEAHFDSLIHKEVYTVPDEMPEPKGGMNNLYKQLSQEIIFPRDKFDRSGIELGKIFIGFVVDADGSIIGKRIIRSIDGIEIAEQMLSVVSKMTWKPGYCNKNPVPVLMIIPLQICLG